MKLGFTDAEERFRGEAAAWLDAQLSGPFRDIRGVSSLAGMLERRQAWERALGAARWSCIGWPQEYGGRNATLAQQVIFAEEYARSGAPGRIGHLGVELAGPTLLAFGSAEQQRRFLPPIARGEEFWCQGYSEPNAGSDLANVRTRAVLTDAPGGREWVVNGQKSWTSLAQFADWIFAVCRTEEGSHGHHGLSYLLIPMRQPGVTVRPIRQMTGEAEFNEVFFVDARTAAANIVGAAGEGWRVAMGTLAFERGVSTLAQQMNFRNELDAILQAARSNGTLSDPDIRQRLAHAYAGLKLMRYSALRMLASAEAGRLSNEAYTYKIFWASWRKKLGVLALDVLGPKGEIAAAAPYEWQLLPQLFLGSRADTIYGGTNQIQRNIIAERALGLPREPRG
ncbi:MAG TPA: acyl-CoA dehydrogenase family protein [Steroidobacteraceae bacterium]|nr:acyl-CoA dehydrogenase family protein [Steroidobacteraceae bacterium]